MCVQNVSPPEKRRYAGPHRVFKPTIIPRTKRQPEPPFAKGCADTPPEDQPSEMQDPPTPPHPEDCPASVVPLKAGTAGESASAHASVGRAAEGSEEQVAQLEDDNKRAISHEDTDRDAGCLVLDRRAALGLERGWSQVDQLEWESRQREIERQRDEAQRARKRRRAEVPPWPARWGKGRRGDWERDGVLLGTCSLQLISRRARVSALAWVEPWFNHFQVLGSNPEACGGAVLLSFGQYLRPRCVH